MENELLISFSRQTIIKGTLENVPFIGFMQSMFSDYLFRAKDTFTAQATVQPTIGLLPIPRKPIIST